MFTYVYISLIYIYYVYILYMNLSYISLKLTEKLFSKRFFMEPCLERRTLKPFLILMIKFLKKSTLIFVAL